MTRRPKRGASPPRSGSSVQFYEERYRHEREFETVDELRESASQRGEPLAKLCIAWALANPTITSVILGAGRPDQLRDTIGAADLPVDAELKKQLDELTAGYRRGDAER
jgi:aryl-alcohol dehydrogenase-like predicted oxidoreductase